MDPHKVLDECKAIIGERGADYGSVESNFSNVAQIFRHSTGVHVIDAHHVAIMMACVKMARMRVSPKKRDNYIDAINYLAFACELIGAE